MNMTIGSVGLLSAIAIVFAPLTVYGQQAAPVSVTASHAGPSHFRYSTEHVFVPHGSAPYAYLWDGYCDEAARRYACKMHHAMNAAAIARQAKGACAAEKFHNMKEAIGERLNVMGPCGHCRHCQGPKATECGHHKPACGCESSDREEPPQPAQPESSDAAGSSSVRPTRDPVVLTPVEPSPQAAESEDLTTTWSPRSPVVRLAPEAPEPSETAPQSESDQPSRRIPRNVIPTRPENPIRP